MNIHHANLFPDLLGAAQFCNISLSENIDVIDSLVGTIKGESELNVPKVENVEIDKNKKVSIDYEPIQNYVQGAAIPLLKMNLKSIEDVIQHHHDDSKKDPLNQIRNRQPQILGNMQPKYVPYLYDARPVLGNGEQIFIQNVSRKIKKEVEHIIRIPSWRDRNDLMAELRSKTRACLRKEGYPRSISEDIAHDIVKIIDKIGKD